MSKLDTLWFDLDLNDQPLLKKLEAAKKRLVDLGVEAKIKVEVNQGELKKSVKEALQNGGTPYKIDVVVDKSKMSKVVKEALDKAGYSQRHDFSTSDARYEKTMADIQTKATEAQARAQVEAQKAADAHALAQEKLAQATLRTERAQQSLANAHERASQSVNSHLRSNLRLGGSLTGLISLSGDLRNQIGMLVSVYTVEHLLKNVVQIGGEFEKQKLAMGSMLGSLEQADDIFNRMKNLALTSPYNFKDLSNYSRQLTAYGTDYKDLYDTTNRLADISAGLGGDMSRLVLAYSQVKSAAYLRGQEMRQFTEFGVALPDLLAQKYSKAEHRIVTAGDVIERVSKRMVSFNDVKDVLWQQTDKGGKFYGMQNVLAQSTSGMASNLKDAIDTMYYDIANSNSGMIKGAIKDITELVSHWRELTSVLVAGTSVYTVYRLVMAAHNRMIGLNNSSTVQSIMLQKQEEAAVLKKASTYRTLTSMERERLMMSRQLTLSDLEQLAANKSLSSEQLIQLARTGRITAAQALEVASLYGLNEAQMTYLMGLQKTGVQMTVWQRLMNTNFITRMRIGIQNLVSSIITLPNVLMAAGAALIYFYTSQKQHRDEMEQANEQTVKNAQDGAKNIQDFLNSNPIGDVLKSNNSTDVSKSLEAYKNQLESSPIDMSSIITNIETIPNATDKLKEMRKALEDLKKAHDDISNSTGNMFVVANEATNGFLNDALSTNLKELNNARRELDTQLSKSGGVTDLNKFISESGNVFPEVVKQLKDMGNAAPNEKMEQLFKIISNNGWGDAFKNELDKSNLSGLSDAYNEYLNYADALKTVQNQFVEFNSNIENQLANSGKNIKNLRQEDILSIKEQAEEYAKSNNITGEALRMFNMNVENTFINSDKQLNNETESWSVFSDTIKQIAEKKGIDLNKASNKQWLQLVNDAKSQCGQIYPWMRTFLSKLIALANNNPIQFVIGIKSTVTGRQPLTGRGKQLAENFGISSLLGYDALTNIKTDKDAADYVKNKYDAYQEDLKNAKANRKSVKAIQQKWDNFKNIMNSQMDVDFIIGGEKTGKKKIKGTKEDTFLKDMENRLDQIKEVMDVYKKWKDTGISEAKAIGYADNSGILAKGTFNGMTSEGDINAWYKKVLNNLTKMMNAAKSTPERKKYTASIAKLIGEFDQKAIKDKLDDMGKQIEKTISDVVKKWDFYKKVKDTTGNEGLAAQLAFGGVLKNKNVLEDIKSRYGQNELAKKSGVSFETFIGMSDSQLDAKGLTSLKKLRDEYISEDDKLKQETVSNLLDLVQKNKDYAQQILDVRIKLAKDLADIEANRSDLTKSGVDVDNLKLTATKKANNEISKINFTKFKEDTDWATIFGDLDKVSNRTLSNMVIKLKEMSMSANMGVDEIKSIQEALKKIEDENLKRNPLSGFVNSLGEVKRWSSILKDINTNGQKDEAGNLSYTYKRDDLTKGVVKGQKVTQSQAENGLQGAYDNEIKSIKNVITGLQSFSDALNQVSNLFDKFGDSKMSDAIGVLGSGLSGALNMGNAATGIGTLFGASQKVLGNLGPWGAAAGAAIGVIGGIADMHDKKLDRAIEKSKEKVKELQTAYQAIEDSLKYHLGDATSGDIINTPAVKRVKEAQQIIEQLKQQGTLDVFGLALMGKENKILKDDWATVKYLKTGNAYEYQRDLYKQQLEQLKQQRDDEYAKKKTDTSKINDYDSQIQDLETKISQFSMDLADSLYGINIKDWANQFGDALFEAWQKGESGADAFQKKADEILSNLVKSWWKTQFIESAFKNVKTDLFGEDGKSGKLGTDNKLTQEELEKLATDVMEAQDGVTKSISNLDQIYAYLQTKGIDIKNTTESSASNAISGITEQEANILAAYADAIHQDTYNIRIDIRKLVEDKGEESNNIMQAQLQQLQAIGTNTYRNAEIVAGIKSMLNDFALGNQKIHIA